MCKKKFKMIDYFINQGFIVSKYTINNIFYKLSDSSIQHDAVII